VSCTDVHDCSVYWLDPHDAQPWHTVSFSRLQAACVTRPLGQLLQLLQIWFDVLVGATSWKLCPAWHSVTLEHTRLVVAVGAVL